MSENAEVGIMRAQVAAERAQNETGTGLDQHHRQRRTYLHERTLVALSTVAFLGLLVVWATAKSRLLLYGSFALVVMLIVFWGVMRIRWIERVRQQRARQAEQWQAKDAD